MFVTTFLIVALLAVVVYITKLLRRHYLHWERLGIAHEKPHWFLGNLQGLVSGKTFQECSSEFFEKFKDSGPFMGFFWFTNSAVLVLDPELIKRILIKDFSQFINRGLFHNEEDDPLTGNLFNLDGAKWRNLRNKLSPGFTAAKMKIMFPLVVQVGKECVNVLHKTIEDNAIVEVADIMARLSTDVIGSCAFGIDLSSLKNPKAEFRTMGRKSLNEFRHGRLGMTFRLNFPQLAQKLHMKETLPDVEKYFLDLVRETVEYREKNNVRRNDFMDMLIDLKNNKLMKSESGEELTSLTFGEMAAQAFVFLTAGYESSSSTLGFALYELALHGEMQQRAREEITEVLERHQHELTYESLKEMIYLEQIMNETSRLYTIAPIINRHASEDYVVPGHPKYVISKGMLVIIPVSAVHRDERYYPNPNEFNPDNFSPVNVAKRASHLYLAFGDGPRNCIAMRFAKMQILISLALLLRHFKFSVCKKTSIPMVFNNESFFLCPGNGIYLKVEKV